MFSVGQLSPLKVSSANGTKAQWSVTIKLLSSPPITIMSRLVALWNSLCTLEPGLMNMGPHQEYIVKDKERCGQKELTDSPPLPGCAVFSLVHWN